MSRLSDIWHGIRSGFDINKMKRDPLGSVAKLAAIYGIGATGFSAVAPKMSADVSNWMKRGFGFYDDTPTSKQGSGYNLKGYADYKGPYSTSRNTSNLTSPYQQGRGFLERQVRGVGEFFASPFDFGRDLNSWYKGDKSWDQVRKDNFGWLSNTKELGEQIQNSGLLGRGGSGGGGGGSGRGQRSAQDIRRGMRDFSPMAANISSAREAGMYKQGGISQALITGAITPESLAMLGYGSGQVTGSGGQTIDIDDVAKIKTTLRSAIG